VRRGLRLELRDLLVDQRVTEGSTLSDSLITKLTSLKAIFPRQTCHPAGHFAQIARIKVEAGTNTTRSPVTKVWMVVRLRPKGNSISISSLEQCYPHFT
jgi:hypothetical protein